MKWRHVLRTVCSLGLLLPVLAWADHGQGPGGSDDDFGGPRMEQALEKLQLSETQHKQVRELMESSRGEMRQLFERRRKAMESMEPGNQKWDEGKARKQARDYGDIAADMAFHRMQMGQKLRAILTPDQWKQLQDMRDEHREQFHDRMKERMKDRMDDDHHGDTHMKDHMD